MPVLANAKHELFAQKVASGMTAGDAYAAAGYSPNPKNADRLKKNEGIVSRIEEILTLSAEKCGVTVERIVSELAHIGFANITDAVAWGEAMPVNPDEGDPYFVQGIELRPSAELPRPVSAAISEVRKTKEGLAIKFHDKNSALEKLGRHLGMFKDKVEHSGPNGGPIQTEEVLSDFELSRRVAFMLERGRLLAKG